MEFYHISTTKLHSHNGLAEIRQSAGYFKDGICVRIPGVYLTGLHSLNSWAGIIADFKGMESELSLPIMVVDIDGRKEVRRFNIYKSPLYLYIVQIPDEEIVNWTEFAFTAQENIQIMAKDFVDNDVWGEVSEVVVQHDCIGIFAGELHNKIVPNAGNYGNCIWDFE